MNQKENVVKVKEFVFKAGVCIVLCGSGDPFQDLVLQCAYNSSLEFIYSLMQVH